MSQINAVTIGKLIEAHREGDEQKFKTYVDLIVKAYEELENDRAARIIRSRTWLTAGSLRTPLTCTGSMRRKVN